MLQASKGAIAAAAFDDDDDDAGTAKPPVWSKWMSRRKASDYLQTVHGIRASYQTLAQHAMHGTGPAYRKQHRFTVYDKADLDRWADLYLSKPCVSTAEHFVQEEQRRKAGVKFDHRKRIRREPEKSEQPAA